MVVTLSFVNDELYESIIDFKKVKSIKMIKELLKKWT